MTNTFSIFMGALTLLSTVLLFMVAISFAAKYKPYRKYTDRMISPGLIVLLSGAVLISFLPGCATVEKYTNAVTNAGIAYDAIDSGDVEASIRSIELSAEDAAKVDKAKGKYIAFINKWKDSIGDFDGMAGRLLAFDADYRLLQNEYATLQTVISANWWRYSPEQQEDLKAYQNRAEMLDESVQEFISAKRNHQALMDALQFSAMIVKLAL